MGLLEKIMKQRRGWRPATAGTLLTAEMTTAAGTIGTLWMTTAVGPSESDSRKVDNGTVEKTAIFSRDTRKSSRSLQLCRTLSNNSRNNRDFTDANSRQQGIPVTVLASADVNLAKKWSEWRNS